MEIRPFRGEDMAAVVQLSLLAWAPVFRSFEHVLGAAIYARLYPDWAASQRAGVEQVCGDAERYTTLVAEAGGGVVGFIAYTVDQAAQTGEIDLLAVHPEHQNHGIGTQLTLAATAAMKERGVRLVVVATGGDLGHAPARRAYEQAGFTALPLVRYYQAL